MSHFAELVGANVDEWRRYVEGLIVTDQIVFGARLDEAQAEINAAGYYVSSGNEVEFCLEPNRPGGVVPNADEFYDEFIQEMCGDTIPLNNVRKGKIVNPLLSAAPIILGEKRMGTYHWENGWLDAYHDGIRMKQIMEARTYPSVDWRESEERRWAIVGTAGRLAAKYKCNAKILGTHETTVISKLEGGELYNTDNIYGNGGLLLAIQGARAVLQPLEPYTSNSRNSLETYPSKVAMWALRRFGVEGRYPLFAIPDTRLQKLAAFAGIKRYLQGKEPWGEGQLRHCQKIDLSLPTATLLFDLMLWDKKAGEMVLPQNMTRTHITAALGTPALKRLDMLTELSQSGVCATDFSENNAGVLRQAVSHLYLFDRELTFNVFGQYRNFWKLLFDGLSSVDVDTLETVRIAYPPLPEGKLTPYDQARTKAASSPDVKEILGPDVLRVLTPAAQAHNSRARLMRTYAPPKQ
ncbi:MAG TPA: hypothetical protein VFB59_00750 [Candidatus Saccharimonadales bacterium]|nr:hypothetical protein [Candidatus Saccharimonadales bacterium]